MPDVIAGPSGGVLGRAAPLTVGRQLAEKHPDLARMLLTSGLHPRAGHDPARWAGVNWDDYRARVGIPARRGLWHITAVDATEGTTAEVIHRWIMEAERLPWQPGAYTVLRHDARGLVMSDLPGEVCGALPFLDYTAAFDGPDVLIAGLGLGIVPAWLLANTRVRHVDVVEIDADLIHLTTRAARSCDETWPDDPRLRIYHGDAHTWTPPAGRRYAAGFLDIWDLVTAANLPSMIRLESRFGPCCDALWSWERPECEAKLARDRGKVVPGA